MSLLLDALSRSERERQQSLHPHAANPAPAPVAKRSYAPWLIAVALLLCLNVILVLMWFGSSDKPTHKTPPPAVKTAPPRPAATLPNIRPLAQAAALGTQHVPDKARESTPATTVVPAAGQKIKKESSAHVNAKAAPRNMSASAVRKLLAQLHMQVHAYAVDPAKRFVVINMRRYEEGDSLAEGPKVMHITRDGVVLKYHGQVFLLPRQH